MSIEDDDDDFGADMDSSELSSPAGMADDDRAHMVLNQPHDEEVSLSDTESFGGDSQLSPSHARKSYTASAGPRDSSGSARKDVPPDSRNPPAIRDASDNQQQSSSAAVSAAAAAVSTSAAESMQAEAGAYNAMDYKHLNVSDDVRELFKYIGRFKPQTIELETKLKPFIPDYIPAVGGIDEFIKVPRPDGKADYLGLKVLDEAAARQSDPTVLNLQLRQLNKEAAGGRVEMVGRVEHMDENRQKKIGQWILSIQDIQKAKPPAVIRHDKPMPDLEAIMQEWPAELEALLQPMHLPTPDLDLDLATYAKLVCSVLDIPVHADPIPSLHLLFSVLLEFRTNPFFRHHLDTAGALPFSAASDSSRLQSASAGATGLLML